MNWTVTMQRAHINQRWTVQTPTRKPNLVGEINQILITSVGDYPNFDMVAGAFKLSGRTLRRQLAGAGTSYQKLVDSNRSEYALNCLDSTNMTTDDIAESLGFSDVANFRHAFKKWIGMSPAAYRANRLAS
jgi:AraC-like DNA-binding protein